MKRLILSLLRQIHVLFRRRALPNRIAIYGHELGPDSREHFKECIAHLISLGYKTVNPRQYAAQEGPKKRLFISFDDNFRDWHDTLEMFDELGATCTFYVTSGVFANRSTIAEQRAFMERIRQPVDRETLTVGQLRDIAKRGHTIGCHTHTHPLLPDLPRDKWDREIAHSKDVLERLIGAEILDFSFPFGMRRDFSHELEAYCGALGFETIATGISGQLYQKSCKPLRIHRTGWKSYISLAENIKNLHLDARIYGALFGRSVIG